MVTATPQTWLERADVYAVALGVTIGASGGSGTGSGSAPLVEEEGEDGEETAVSPSPSNVTITAVSAPAGLIVNNPNVIDYVARYNETVLGIKTINWGNRILVGLIAITLTGGAGFVVWNERRMHQQNIPVSQDVAAEQSHNYPNYPAQVKEQFQKEQWSPDAAGALLGVVGILAVWLNDSLLGASGAFENLAGTIGQTVAPQLFDNLYFNYVMPPGLTWSGVLLIGIFFGGMIGAWSSSTLKLRLNSDEQWKKVFSPSWQKRWLYAFLGAIVLEIGAGIAGGCTSGLAISGGMLLAPAAFIFIGAMFASGIATAWLVYGRRF